MNNFKYAIAIPVVFFGASAFAQEPPEGFDCPPGSLPAIKFVAYDVEYWVCAEPPPPEPYIPINDDAPELGDDEGAETQLDPPNPNDDPGEALGSGRSEGRNGHGDCAEDGNPVNILSRNKYQREVDFIGPGNLPLKIIRNYNSYGANQLSFAGEFGRGWSAGFGDKIIAITEPGPSSPDTHSVLIETDTGYRFKLSSVSGGDWTTTSGRTLPFSYNAVDERFVWIDNGLIKVFGNEGHLLSVTHETGESLTYFYVASSSPAKLDRIEHSYGGELSFTYNAQGRISVITGALSEQYKYFYDAYGNLDYVERPTSTGSDIVNYTYASGPLYPHFNLLSEKSFSLAPSVFARFDYTAGRANKTERITTGDVSVEKVQFAQISAAPNLKVETTNPHGKKTVYHFAEIAGQQRLTQVDGIAHGSCAASNSTYTYDSYGFYDKVTDEEGNVTDYNYNQKGHLLSVTTGFGTSESRTTTYTTHPVWEKPDLITTPLLDVDIDIDVYTGWVTEIRQTNKSQYGVPGQQRVTTVNYETHPDSIVVKKVTVDGPRSDVDDRRIFNYDTSGRLTSIQAIASSTVTLTTTFGNFDAYGRPRQIVSPAGMVTNLVYGPNGRVLSSTRIVNGQNRQTQFEYSGTGDLWKVTHPDGSIETYGYDPARRLTSITRADGSPSPAKSQRRTFGYDVASNITSDKRYDVELVWVPNPFCPPSPPPPLPPGDPEFPDCSPGSMQLVSELRYDMFYDYDSLNRLIKQTWDDPGRDREYTYRKDNRLSSSIDGYSRSTSYDYNANVELDDTTFRDGGISKIEYDANGRISGVRDALGQWTYYRRDGFGSAWQIVSPATGTTFYEYDIAGNQKKETDARGIVLNHEYDALGRILTTKIGSSQTAIHEFEYDTNRPGYLYRVTDEAGTHTFLRNQAGELTSRTDVLAGQSLTTTFTYDVHGRLYRIGHPSGLTATYTFDELGQVFGVTASGGGLSTSTVVSDVSHYPWGPVRHFTFGNGEERSQTLDQDYESSWLMSGNYINRTYQRDLNGNISGFDSRSFTYDNMDRLKTHAGPDGNYEYNYDLNGNRGWHKRNGTTTNYNYNTAKTRLTSLSGGTSENRYYDANGNTTRIGNRYFDHNDLNRLWRYREGSVTVTYTHNAFGERQMKQQGSTITRYVYSGPSLLHERVGSTKRDYIYLGGEPIALVKNGTLYYIHNDHLGRPELVTNSAKSVVWSSQNNAFGNTPGTDLIGNLNIGFPGQYYDIESGTYYNYFRTYDSLTGRYLQSDPIGLNGGLNTYSYAYNNPINFIDPLGLYVGNGEFGPHPSEIPGGEIDWECAGQHMRKVGEWIPGVSVIIAVGDVIVNPNGENAISVVLSVGGPITKAVGRVADALRATKKAPVPNKRTELPGRDNTGKVHGDLPRVEELDRYDPDDLRQLKSDLEKSVEERIRRATELGYDRAHGQRQGAEQDLIKAIEKHLSE